MGLPNKSILFLTRYSRLGASSRYRFLQFLPALELAGFHCNVSPLLDDEYLVNRYAHGRGRLIDYAKALLGRLLSLVTAYRYDLLVIEKELLMYFPAVMERFLAFAGIPYVVDYDDAIFHQYDQSNSWLVRTLLSGKIATVMRHSSMVIAGNAYLAEYARSCGSRQVETVPTVVDLDRYVQALPAKKGCFVIGWIGSPSTYPYLHDIAPALAEVCAGGRARVVLVGSGPVQLSGVPVTTLPWAEESEVADMSSFDVGIMPLPDKPWARGKCGFKLIQYMACGLPVVASPVGVNSQIVAEGENGFLAQCCDDWVRALSALRDDEDLRRRMGKSGRSRVEERYCLQVVAPKLISLFEKSLVTTR